MKEVVRTKTPQTEILFICFATDFAASKIISYGKSVNIGAIYLTQTITDLTDFSTIIFNRERSCKIYSLKPNKLMLFISLNPLV